MPRYGKAFELQPVSSEKHPPVRLTPPEAFPDLDAALAARGIALKATAPCRRVVEPDDPLTDAAQQPADLNGRSSPHPLAFTGAVLGLALMGLLVFSVIRVSGESIRPAAPILNMPATSTAVPTPVVAMQPPAELAAPPPPAPEVAPPQLAAASLDVPPPVPASPGAPSALLTASTMTAQTMTAKPPPPPENTPEDSMRSRLHERFPVLFPDP